MNILHISDIHFGPYHWHEDDNAVLDRLNAFNADIVINTGDITSDSLPVEFREGEAFLAKIKCPNIVSIMGNHDKYSKRSHEMFVTHIFGGEMIEPFDVAKVKKKKIFIDPTTAKLDNYFTDVNFLREFEFNGEKVLIIGVDTNLFQSDSGHVDEHILHVLAEKMSKLTYDRALLLSHHSVLSTDEDPLVNSKRLSDFILKNKVEAVFCGHTHELDIVRVSDLVKGGTYRQFMCGSLSSINTHLDANMFCTYENFGEPDEIITVTRIRPGENGLIFEESIVSLPSPDAKIRLAGA